MSRYERGSSYCDHNTGTAANDTEIGIKITCIGINNTDIEIINPYGGIKTTGIGGFTHCTGIKTTDLYNEQVTRNKI